MRFVSSLVLALVVVWAVAAPAAGAPPVPTPVAVMPSRVAELVIRGARSQADALRLSALAALDQPGSYAFLRRALPVRPVPGEITSPYGSRKDPLRPRRVQKRHTGLDLEAHRGTPVVAAGAGVVVRAGHRGGYGRLVVVDHGNGVETYYAHLSRVVVKRGQVVEPGTLLGKAGASGRVTGPHLHFEIRFAGTPVDPGAILATTP